MFIPLIIMILTRATDIAGEIAVVMIIGDIPVLASEVPTVIHLGMEVLV